MHFSTFSLFPYTYKAKVMFQPSRHFQLLDFSLSLTVLRCDVLDGNLEQNKGIEIHMGHNHSHLNILICIIWPFVIFLFLHDNLMEMPNMTAWITNDLTLPCAILFSNSI